MRIAYVNQDAGVAPSKKKGAVVHVEAMRKAFAGVGAEVLALDIVDDRELVAELDRAHQRAPLDLVYERYALKRCAASTFAHSHGIPHVLEVNAPLADEEERWRDGARAAVDPSRERELFGRAMRVLAVSSDVERYCHDRGASAERTVLTPNAVDPDLFRPRDGDAGLRSALVPAGRLALGFHGRLRPWHNFPMLVAAMQRLIERDVPIHLLVLGEGEFERELAQRIDPSRTTLLGWKPHAEAAAIVACTDVLPLTYSAAEPCYFSPLKLLEGMSAGAVPVVPALGDLTRVVRHEHNGLVYTADDLEALVESISRLQRGPDLRNSLARNARAMAETHSWTHIARSVLGLVSAENAP